MGLWTKLTGGQDMPPAGRTPKERRRRAKEISRIDASTTAWLKSGGRAANRLPKGWN